MKKAVGAFEVTERLKVLDQSESAVATKTEKIKEEETMMTRLTVKELRERAKAAGILSCSIPPTLICVYHRNRYESKFYIACSNPNRAVYLQREVSLLY